MAGDEKPPTTETSTTTIRIGSAGDDEPLLYPTEEVGLDEQRRHFCLMLAAERQGIAGDDVVALAAKFDDYLRSGAVPPKLRVAK